MRRRKETRKEEKEGEERRGGRYEVKKIERGTGRWRREKLLPRLER